jgi:hypothetical protein
MTEYDYWKIFPRMPKKVTIGDITIRDGFQHEEKTISTAAKIFYGVRDTGYEFRDASNEIRDGSRGIRDARFESCIPYPASRSRMDTTVKTTRTEYRMAAACVLVC